MKMHNKLHVLGMMLILIVPMLLMVSVANAQPANDAFVNAPGIPGIPFTFPTINTSAATVSPDDPSNCSVPYNTVWYKGTSGADLVLEANTVGSDYDTILTVVTGTPGNFTLIACSDDAQGSLQSQVIINVSANVPYYFMVGSKAAGGGTLVLNVKEGINVTTTTTTPKPCAAETIYGENSEETELLREYRDNVLSKTPDGQEFIKNYYKFSPPVTKVLEQRPLLKSRVKAFIDGMLPGIRKKVAESNNEP